VEGERESFIADRLEGTGALTCQACLSGRAAG
jgi:hypothetical protein